MKWGLFACVALLSCSLPVIAQQLHMEGWLNTGTDADRVQKMVSLGVKQESAELAVGDKVKWRVIRSESRQENALLFIPCGAVSSSFLYLLVSTGHSWRVADEVDFDCHYDDSVSFDAASLRSADVDDVLVHHECEGHGTGFVQQNFNVFVIVSSKFKLVLNTKEIIKASGWPDGHELNQRSSFAVTPNPRTDSHIIEETRRTRENGKLAIEKREFRWSPTEFRFVPSRFIKVK